MESWRLGEPVLTNLVVTRSSFSWIVTKTRRGEPFFVFVGELELLEAPVEVGDNPFPFTKGLLLQFPGGFRNRPVFAEVKFEVFCKGIRSGVKCNGGADNLKKKIETFQKYSQNILETIKNYTYGI